MSVAQNSVCQTVASGRVGETGASTLLVHEVEANLAKMMVVRKQDSSLCPNTGVIATLSVNCKPVACANLTDDDPLSAEVQPGDTVTLIVHTIPMFNGIMCARLGDFDFQLDECDLV
jgi:uncharacterized Zn-binding protein involved in type VI secretion